MKRLYKDGYEKLNEEYSKKTSRQKYSKVPDYVDFKTAIWVRSLYPLCHQL